MTDQHHAIPPLGSFLPVWPGQPPGPPDWTWSSQETLINGEMLARNITVPTLEVFPATGPATGTAVIVAPGGAFHVLATQFEGSLVAQWLASRGVAAFVLRYRLARTPDTEPDLIDFLADLDRRVRAAPARAGTHSVLGAHAAQAMDLAGQDGRQAVRHLRDSAPGWGLDPARIGFIGFSAGAWVSLNAATAPQSHSRPDFAAAIYGPRLEGSQVPAAAPPLFLAAALDDPAVPPTHSVHTWQSWHEAGRQAELHVFATGGHGFGMRQQGLGSDAWLQLFGSWLDGLELSQGLAGR